MPLSHTPCCPLPEVELLRRKPITPKEAAEKLRAYCEEEAKTAAADLATTGKAQVSYNQLNDVLLRLETDWVNHTEKQHLDCFVEVDAHTEVHLHPCYLGARLKQGLRKAAGEILLKFQRSLGCIPLTMADLQPAGSRHGAVVGDTPYVHFIAKFRCVGFAPTRDHWLLGRVAQEQPHSKGMNINVLSLVNIRVQHDSLPRELRYDREQRAWMNGDDQLSERHLVLLRLAHVNTDAQRQGDMGIELTGIVETTGHIKARRRNPKLADADSPGPSVAETPPVKKRRKEATPGTEGRDDTNGAVVNGDENGAEESARKKNKKDKKAAVVYA